MRFIWKECGVNASKNHPCTAITCLSPHLEAAKRDAGVQPNANHVAGLNGCGVNRL
jgi:hypothetical protein